MIEMIVNFVQLIISGTCAGLAMYHAAISKGRDWLMLALFFFVFFSGDLYWQFYLFFYHMSPQYSYICEPAWYSSFLFLVLLLLEVRDEEQKALHYRLPWISIIFTVGMGLFYMQKGDYLSNLVVMIFMSLLLWHAIHGLLFLRNRKNEGSKKRFLYWAVLFFCLVEYTMWTISMFWMGDTLWNPYYWCDLLLSVTMLIFLPALRKAKSL